MNILVTGGAGFIGSNLTKALLELDTVKTVRVLDNLATGFWHNLAPYEKHPKFEFIKGDIRDIEVCQTACKGINLISHQAALGSVPRSVKDPLSTNAVNITGFLNIFTTAKELGIERIVFAASSSTYGDDKSIPKVENKIGQPLSPYAVTKLVNELYAKVYSNLYNIEFVGLRYFNIFGPQQDPNGAYAAVVPLFMKAAIENKAPTINGDGTFSRDFTYIDNAVHANLLALFTQNSEALNQIYNIACGERTSLNELWEGIQKVTNTNLEAKHGPNRVGDLPHSLADISKARDLLNYEPKVKIQEGLLYTYDWYKNKML